MENGNIQGQTSMDKKHRNNENSWKKRLEPFFLESDEAL